MRLSFLTVAIILSTASIVPRVVVAAGQPQLGSKESEAATNGKTSEQAEKSKMDVKREHDAQKYQGQGAPGGNR